MKATNNTRNTRFHYLISRITVLFLISFVFLWLHILDDAFVTNEPSWYGITIAEFLLYCAIIYVIVPPLGLWLARRGSIVGLVIVLGYAFQAMYGGGLNHVRHLFGDYRGSQFLPIVLKAVGIPVTDIQGHGFLTVIGGMAGLGVTPPHTHNLLSTLVAFTNVGLNAVLILFTAMAIYTWWQARSARRNAAAPAQNKPAPTV